MFIYYVDTMHKIEEEMKRDGFEVAVFDKLKMYTVNKAV